MNKAVVQRLAQFADEGGAMRLVVFAAATTFFLFFVVMMMSAMAFRLFVVVFMLAATLFFLVLVMVSTTAMLTFFWVFSSPRGGREGVRFIQYIHHLSTEEGGHQSGDGTNDGKGQTHEGIGGNDAVYACLRCCYQERYCRTL